MSIVLRLRSLLWSNKLGNLNNSFHSEKCGGHFLKYHCFHILRQLKGLPGSNRKQKAICSQLFFFPFPATERAAQGSRPNKQRSLPSKYSTPPSKETDGLLTTGAVNAQDRKAADGLAGSSKGTKTALNQQIGRRSLHCKTESLIKLKCIFKG